MEHITVKDLVAAFTLVSLVGSMWFTIIKTIRSELTKIEQVVEKNTVAIDAVKTDLGKTKNAMNREFVTKVDLKDRLAWGGQDRRHEV